MEQARVIECYERLLLQSRRMHECALRGDWQAILDLRTQGLIDEEALRRNESGVQLDEVNRQRKFELLRQILELEGQVRHCLAKRQGQLGTLILASRRQQEQGDAYRAPAKARPSLRAVARPEV